MNFRKQKNSSLDNVKENPNLINNFDDLDVNTKAPIKIGLIVLIAGFGGFIAWAAFAPLDEGVPSQGTVSIETKRKVIQHKYGGIVKEVLVKEGQFVKADEILIRLDDVDTKARYEDIRQKYISDRALESRLIAEQNNSKVIKFHEDLINEKEDILIQQQMLNQQMLLDSRKSSLKAEISAINQNINAQESHIKGLHDVLETKKSQLDLIQSQLDSINDLVADGYVPRSQKTDLEFKYAQMKGEISDYNANIFKEKFTISELKQRIIFRQEEYKKDVDTQMSNLRREVDANSFKLNSLKDDLTRTEIKSPVDGQVVGLQIQTIGSVIQSGQKVLEVVPVNESLLLEVKVPPQLIDRVHTGQKADIRFSSFSNSPQLAVEGEVQSLSRDLLLEPNTSLTQPGSSYYLARVIVTQAGLKTLNGRVLQSGMPAQVIIKTGERSLLKYLLHPLTKRLSASLTEE